MYNPGSIYEEATSLTKNLIENWLTHNYTVKKSASQQPNMSDCGVYTIMYIHQLVFIREENYLIPSAENYLR
jgi:Ulp1 family protease